MHRSLNFVFWLEWRAKTLVIAIFESQKSGSLDQDYLGSFAMKIVEFVYVWWYFITVGCWKNRRESLEVSAEHVRVCFCMRTCLNVSFFLKQIEKKQHVQTSFRCVWANGNFSTEAAAVFFPWNVKGHSNRDVCASAHFSSQGGSKGPSLVQIGVKATGQETSSDFVVSFRFAVAKVGTWERRTVCLSGRFF